MNNLIISAVGDNSLHKEWISGNRQFDLCLIYYGNNKEKANQYALESKYFLNISGQKFSLIKSFLESNPEIFEIYDFIWMPDDDISISTDKINLLFEISKNFKLDLCQPAMDGFYSHKITLKSKFTYLRYTNFVEVLAPLMSSLTLSKLYKTFTISQSGWGMEFYWESLLGKPRDKIAIIDKVVMLHTRPIGTDYSRFKIHPKNELILLNDTFKLGLNVDNFIKNFKIYKRIYKFY